MMVKDKSRSPQCYQKHQLDKYGDLTSQSTAWAELLEFARKKKKKEWNTGWQEYSLKDAMIGLLPWAEVVCGLY